MAAARPMRLVVATHEAAVKLPPCLRSFAQLVAQDLKERACDGLTDAISFEQLGCKGTVRCSSHCLISPHALIR